MPPDRDIDRELRDLGPRVEYPNTPDIARLVRDKLEEGDGTSGSPSRTRPQLWWIAAAALVLLVSVPVFSLAVRDSGGGGAAGGAANVEAGSGGQAVGERPERVNELRTGPVLEAQGDDAASGGASAGAGAMAIQDGSGGAGSAKGGASGEDLGLGKRIPLREARARAQV